MDRLEHVGLIGDDRGAPAAPDGEAGWRRPTRVDGSPWTEGP